MASNILEEYLIALGFKIDAKGAKDFKNTLGSLEKQANNLAANLFKIGGTAAAMVGVFVYQMEKLYYASRRIKSSAANIQALEYGAEQIGISGETMRATLENLAKTIRLNPGIQGLIKSFGIEVEGRDMSDVARDLVKALSGMPHYVAAQFANLFGIDEQTLLMWKEGLGVLDEAANKRKQMASDMGVDVDAAAEASKDLLNTWRELVEFMKLFGMLLVQTMLPALKEVAGVVKSVLTDWGKILREGNLGSKLMDAVTDFIKRPLNSVKNSLTPDARRRIAAGETNGVTVGAAPAPPAPPPATTPASGTDFDALERKYGLPAGVLDRIWKQESNRGQNMLSPAGAKGHFQFMDATAEQYGVKDPNDLAQSAEGAAKYMRDLLKKYGGDLRSASGAYNWGPGNMDRYGAGRAPEETQKYMDAIGGVKVEQKTEITVNGVQSPAETARLVARNQDMVNSNLVRNLGGVVQ